MIKGEKIKCIEQWKNIILSGDSSKLTEIIDENAIFYSPVVFTPQVGKQKVIHYLSNAVKIFQNKDFNYTKTIKRENLFFAEFNAKFDEIIVNGIDLISIKNNLILEFKVFLRPFKGLEVIWKEMSAQLK